MEIANEIAVMEAGQQPKERRYVGTSQSTFDDMDNRSGHLATKIRCGKALYMYVSTGLEAVLRWYQNQGRKTVPFFLSGQEVRMLKLWAEDMSKKES